MAILSLKKAKTVGKHVVAKEDGVDFVPFAVCPMVLLVFVVIQDLMEAVQLEWSKLFVILTSGILSIFFSKIRLKNRLENFIFVAWFWNWWRSKNHYQCVIPKTMDDNVMTHYTMLDRPNCWSNCGRKRGWAGRCSYCGPNGYCCHADGRGGCTTEMADVLKVNRKRGMRCIVPDTIKNDLRTETKVGFFLISAFLTVATLFGIFFAKRLFFASRMTTVSQPSKRLPKISMSIFWLNKSFRKWNFYRMFDRKWAVLGNLWAVLVNLAKNAKRRIC